MQSGFGLMEVLLTVAAGALLAGASYTLYRSAADNEQVAQEQNDVATIQEKTIQQYASRNAFDNLTPTSAIAQGVYPSNLVPTQGNFGTAIKNVWGGGISVQGTTIDGGISNNGFTITYSNVPASVCARFASAAGNGFYEVTVTSSGSTTGAGKTGDLHTGSVLDASNRAHVDPRAAAQRCTATSLSDVSFTYATNPLPRTTCAGTGPIPPNAGSQTASCPETGTTNSLPQIISDPGPDQYNHTWQQTHSQDGSCGANGLITWGPWSPWSPNHGCADRCIPLHTSATDNRVTACPSGQLVSTPGASLYQPSWAQTQTSTTTQSCSTPIGPLTGASVVVGAWLPVLSCSPVCAPASAPQTQPAACPPGQLASTSPYGSTSGTQTRIASQACTTPIGPLGPVAYSPWGVPQGQSCAPACTPVSTTQTQPAPCPAGQIATASPYGSTSGVQTRVMTQSCATPVGPLGPATYTPWSAPQGQSCAPACTPTTAPQTQTVACPAGTTGSWAQTRTVSMTCASPVSAGTPVSSPWSPAVAPPGSCAPTCAPVSTAVCPPFTPTGYSQLGPTVDGTRFCSEYQGCPAGYSGSGNSYRSNYTAATPTACASWGPWSHTPANCTANPPGCSWPTPPSATPACPSGGNQSGGTWIHGATCPSWVYSSGSCPSTPPPGCSWPSPPSTTPACPGGGNQSGGTWVHGATCPSWAYSGGTCPAPPPVCSTSPVSFSGHIVNTPDITATCGGYGPGGSGSAPYNGGIISGPTAGWYTHIDYTTGPGGGGGCNGTGPATSSLVASGQITQGSSVAPFSVSVGFSVDGSNDCSVRTQAVSVCGQPYTVSLRQHSQISGNPDGQGSDEHVVIIGDFKAYPTGSQSNPTCP